jgi:hypothetical protein
MDSQLQRYARRLVEEQLGRSKLLLAQVVSDISTVKTEQDTKFSDDEKIHLMRYKILLYGIHSPDVPKEALPWAYPNNSTSGLRGESIGTVTYPRGTFVYVTQDLQSGEYFIERVAPNTVKNLPLTTEQAFAPLSGFDPRNTLYPAPDTLFNDGALVPGNEEYNVSFRSYADYLQNTPRDEAKLQFPVLDSAKNTVGGMSSAIENAIKDVETLKKNLIGSNSLLRQSLESIENVEKSVDIVAQALGKQIKLIAGYIQNIMAKVLKKMLRKWNAVSNFKTALKTPNTGKFADNQLISMMTKIIKCAFGLGIAAIPEMVGKGLLGIIGKVVNNAGCLVENFISNFVGQITGQLSALINGAISSIAGVLGGVTDILGSIGDVLDSIMNLLKCEVTPSQKDPVIKEWNFLDGGSPVKITLNVGNIFEKAKKVGETVQKATKVPKNISNYEFKFDAESAINDTITQDCPTGPQECGVPDVTFWGGTGSGAKGNPVVSAVGELIGVDIVESGNYTQAPYVSVSDKCGGGRGAVAEAILGPVETFTPTITSDIDGTIIAGTNYISGFNLLPDAPIENNIDLVGRSIMQLSNSPSIPAGTKIIDVKGDKIFLNKKIEGDGSVGDMQFHIIGFDPEEAVSITTFDVAVKKTPRTNKFVIDNRQQRVVTLERGKTYKFDQSRPSNGVILEGGKDELVLMKGEDAFGEISTGEYQEINRHPLRFSTKSDGIHNCDRSVIDEGETDWLVSRLGMPSNAWVLTSSAGWSQFLQTYGVYPAYKVLPGVHTGNWEIIIPSPGTYRVEIQADNLGTVSWNGIYLGATDPIPLITKTSKVFNEVNSVNRDITFNQCNKVNFPLGQTIKQNGKKLELKDGDGPDTNASFTIESGDAVFKMKTNYDPGNQEVDPVTGEIIGEIRDDVITSTDQMVIEGTGTVTITLNWSDNPSIAGVAVESIVIGGTTWFQSGGSGRQTETIKLTELEAGSYSEITESYEDLSRGPHNTPKYFEFEVFESGKKHILTSTIQNTPRENENNDSLDWNRNPAALAWQVTNLDGTIAYANSTQPFAEDPEAFLTNCGTEYTDNVTINGTPGAQGSYIQIEVDVDTPDTLYYYCENHPKMGAKINIVDAEDEVDESMGCRNAVFEVTSIFDIPEANRNAELFYPEGDIRNEAIANNYKQSGRVTAFRLLRGGTGYSAGATNMLTVGGNGTSLSFNIVNVGNDGNITGVQVSNGGKNYQVGDLITPVCNLGTKIVKKEGTGVIKVIIKETGYDYLPWPDGSKGGMERTWAGRCQTIVHRKNGDWDIPYSYGEVITLYEGDCITLPAKEEVCIDENFDISKLPGAELIGEPVTPRDMSDFPVSKYTIEGGGDGIDFENTRFLEYLFVEPKFIPINIDFKGLNSANQNVTVTNNRTKILLRDGDGVDTNAYFEIEEVNGGIARFTPDGRSIAVQGDYVDVQLALVWKDYPTVAGVAVDTITIRGLNGDKTWTQTGERGIDRDLVFLSGDAKGTYIERIDGSDPDFPAGVAQWWFYINGRYQGTVVQDSLAEIPQLVKRDDGIIYRIGEYQENKVLSVVVDPKEWYRVVDILDSSDPNIWVLNDPQGWSPFLKNYGVWPSRTDTLVNAPQVGVWDVVIIEEGSYYFEVQADNQGSITFDGTFLGSTTVFKSHNRSTFFEVDVTLEKDENGNPIPRTAVIEATILNAARGKDDAYDMNPGALGWVFRKGESPVAPELVTTISYEYRDIVESKHDVTYTGLNAANNPILVEDAGKSLCLKDGDGPDCNARFTVVGGIAKFIDGANRIEGTGNITLRLEWNDRPRTAGVAVETIQIGSVTWTQAGRSGTETKTVTLEGTVIGTEKIEVRKQSLPSVFATGDIIRSSLDPFRNTLEETRIETKSYFSIAKYEILDDNIPPGTTIFKCEPDYTNAKLLGYTDCDIRAFLEANPDIEVDQCMQDKLDDDDWGKCGDFSVRLSAPPCPEEREDPCPEGYRFVNGQCVLIPPGPDECPTGFHKDEHGNCVPDDDTCPPGYKKENGVCVPIVPSTCPPSDTYRVISCLDEIIVANPGFGYNCCDDTVVIEPSNGAEAVIEECDGGIIRIRVTNCGAGFKELPEVYINTNTGLNAFLIPILKFHRENLNEFPEGTVVTQIIDCVGNVGKNAKTEVT